MSQAFDPMQIRPSCPEVNPPHPPLQWFFSTSTEQVLAKPLSHHTVPLLSETREGSATGGSCQEIPGAALLSRAFRILEECKELWIEKHWAGTSPWVSTDDGITRDNCSSLKRLRLLLQQSQPVPLLCPPSFHVFLSCAFVLIPF